MEQEPPVWFEPSPHESLNTISKNGSARMPASRLQITITLMILPYTEAFPARELKYFLANSVATT
jgi:hypothetical protein